MTRSDLLQPTSSPSPHNDEPIRTVLSLVWHPRFHFMQKVLHTSYSCFTSKYPYLKQTFPQPPMVAFRKNRSLRNILTNARSGPKSTTVTPPNPPTRAALIEKNISKELTITNERTGASTKTVSGNAKSRNIIYAAKCKKCKLTYIGYTTQALNERFNQHRSDIKLHPERSELPKHFSESPSCDFDRDLEVSIIEKDVFGGRQVLEAREDYKTADPISEWDEC